MYTSVVAVCRLGLGRCVIRCFIAMHDSSSSCLRGRTDGQMAKALAKSDPDLVLILKTSIAILKAASMMRVLPISPAAECCSRAEQWPRANSRYPRHFSPLLDEAMRPAWRLWCSGSFSDGCRPHSSTGCRSRTREHARLLSPHRGRRLCAPVIPFRGCQTSRLS